jgi:hypothetical protein
MKAFLSELSINFFYLPRATADKKPLIFMFLHVRCVIQSIKINIKWTCHIWSQPVKQ